MNQNISPRGKVRITVLSFLLVLMIAYVKLKVGYGTPLSVLYLLPILLTTFFVSRPVAFFIALASAVAFPIVDIISGVHFTYVWNPLWDGAVRFCVYMSFVLAYWFWENEKKSSRKDYLTGIANRMWFYEMTGMEVERCRRYKRVFTVAYIDCDNFKKINDQFGNRTGDELLRTVANALRDNTRVVDLVARLGGDKFGVLLPETGEAGGGVFVSKIHRKITDVVKENKWDVTFSVGSITCLEAPPTVDKMIQKAEELMNLVKKNGRDRFEHQTIAQW